MAEDEHREDRREELERDVRARLGRHRAKLGDEVFERTVIDIVRITLKYEQTATPTTQERERLRASIRQQTIPGPLLPDES